MTQVVAGSRRWWNLVDSVSLSLLLIALAERSRTLGNFVAMQRVGRLLRLPRFRMEKRGPNLVESIDTRAISSCHDA